MLQQCVPVTPAAAVAVVCAAAAVGSTEQLGQAGGAGPCCSEPSSLQGYHLSKKKIRLINKNSKTHGKYFIK